MHPAKADPTRAAEFPAASALSFIVLLGIVSLFADMAYEGARSLNGQYLSFLGASATAVGLAAGTGEFLGYALRFVSGYISDRTRRYWAFTFIGYVVNLAAAPALALAGRWEWAVGLILVERIGKAIRNPARDAMLSQAASSLGAGKSFGLHEALDQIGAVLGPIVITAVLFFRGNGQAALSTFQAGYAFLLIPALLAWAALVVAWRRFPNPHDLPSKTPHLGARGFSRSYWWFLLAAGLIAAGFADFPLVAFHFEKAGVLPVEWIPAAYALAMGVDALAALALGRLFDRRGLPVVMIAFAVSALFAPLVFLGHRAAALAGMVVWGIGMGAQESILRAAVVDLAPADLRGTAFGLFHTAYGIFWLAGSAVMGVLYDRSPVYVAIFSLIVQLAAIPTFFKARR